MNIRWLASSLVDIYLQFHRGESDPWYFLFRFLFFRLRRRLCSISFFLKEENRNVGQINNFSGRSRYEGNPASFEKKNLGSTSAIITSLDTELYHSQTLQAAVSKVTPIPKATAPTFQIVCCYCYRVHTHSPGNPDRRFRFRSHSGMNQGV